MRIRIIGSCGSGKSTAARQLAAMYGTDYYETDNLVWDRSEEGLRYPIEVRDRMPRDIVLVSHQSECGRGRHLDQ
ncbi:hypothetical protein [Paenibacillus sp. FJAT-26967]|uniref:hypothetical protein n=1 Tax=Paenibacillus sp. FJAT-26967 TaxID=1729690 RepID=UPI0012E359AC|nr:hypothetical protein [Paenibacillus sp. FJAT-26967]